jgi:plastocyanin
MRAQFTHADERETLTTRARVLICSAALVAAVAAGGCGSSSGSAVGSTSSATTPTTAPAATTTVSPAAAGATITIHDFMFGDAVTVKAGETVTVMNSDTTTHTLAADDNSFDTGNIFAGKSATFVAPKAGTYKFHCNIHANMHGVLTVTA